MLIGPMENAAEDFIPNPTVKLYKRARKHNWDDGYSKLYTILRNKHCDKGTALMMYWLSSPQFFTQYASAESVPEWAYENYKFLRDVEERFLEIQKEEIMYDPVADDRISKNKYAVKVPIPKMMLLPTKGTIRFDEVDVYGSKKEK